MTLQELYASIDGNYDHAVQIMRMEKLINRYLSKFPNSGVYEALAAAGESMDPTALLRWPPQPERSPRSFAPATPARFPTTRSRQGSPISASCIGTPSTVSGSMNRADGAGFCSGYFQKDLISHEHSLQTR